MRKTTLNSLPTSQNKQELRQRLLAERDARAEAARRALDAALCERLTALPCLQTCSALLLYFPVGSEIDLLPLAAFAFAHGIPVGFPVCLAEPNELIFRQATPQTRFVCGKFGIPVPPEGAPQLVPDEQTVCLLPALGYDRDLNRLGYGGGYYDRFLQTFLGLAVGVCREDALCPTVFPEPHDLPIDLLVTEKSTLRGKIRAGASLHAKNEI